MFDTHVNLLSGTVHTAPSPATSGETLILMPGDGARFEPNMPVTLCPPEVSPRFDNSEIAYVTAVEGRQLTLLRAQEGSLAMPVDAGWQVIAGLTAKSLTDIETVLEGKADRSEIPAPVDISGKADKSYVDSQDGVLTTALDGKVDKQAGKTLSSNDYTNDEKDKLSGIAAGATQNMPDAALRDRATHTGSQPISSVTGLQGALDWKAASSHTHTAANISNFDSAVSANADVAASTSARHTHGNKTVLDNTTASFTTGDKSKLDGVAPGATANDTDANLKSRSNHTGTQAISTVSGLQTALDGKAASGHTHTIANVSGLQTALDAKVASTLLGANNGVATLDAGGKVNQSQLPSITITEVFTVATEAAMVALVADEGDVAIRTDLNKSFIHNGGTAGTAADWSELLTPTAGVSSVNGQTGAVTVSAVPGGGSEGQVLKVVSGVPAWGADNNTTYTAPSQAEAEAGTATTSRTFTAQRVNQAIQALAPVKSVAGKTGAVTLAKADVGLGSVDNTADADKPISTATQTALDGKASTTHTHTAAQVTDFETAVSANTNVTANTAARHSHSNKTVLDATTASFLSADRTKLDGIATGATANSADATLLNRANHTGTQAISTVTGLQTALDGKAASSHTHSIANVTNLQATLDGKVNGTVRITVGTTAPTSPSVNDVWIDVN
ncbi:hypothetical protein [Rhodococcus sp. HS-D2]|uniref:hypothetical protein n=1 Tax=Rhodococcus sp. HS-D2 TaxID=1384636 RepID=UPI0009EEBBD5|nr:hypothetical protein [Rhodococcus sp. HS-D2]